MDGACSSCSTTRPVSTPQGQPGQYQVRPLRRVGRSRTATTSLGHHAFLADRVPGFRRQASATAPTCPMGGTGQVLTAEDRLQEVRGHGRVGHCALQLVISRRKNHDQRIRSPPPGASGAAADVTESGSGQSRHERYRSCPKTEFRKARHCNMEICANRDETIVDDAPAARADSRCRSQRDRHVIGLEPNEVGRHEVTPTLWRCFTARWDWLAAGRRHRQGCA